MGIVAKNPLLLYRVIDENEDFRQAVIQKHGFAKGLPTVDFLDICPNIDITVDPYSFLDETSMISDMALLNYLAQRTPNCHYLEIGSWRGESVANVARYAERCVSLSLSRSEMEALQFAPEFIAVSNVFSEPVPKIEHIGHNSQTFDFRDFYQAFDLIFVDGDHSYKGIRSDSQNAFKLLKNEASVIVWHDYGLGTERVRWETLLAILDATPRELHRYLYHVSNTMCAIFIRANFPTQYPEFPARPNKKFSIALKASKL